ncbi:MAG: 5'-3' exonuclease [Acidimicrobiales bacterium]
MDVHVVDGTYELFRQYFGQKTHRREAADGMEVAATIGVLNSMLTMIDEGATHLAVATDHKVESFRNAMWPTYKTSAGIAPELLAQFGLLEDALRGIGIRVFAMDELEADDAMASVAAVACDDDRVDRVLIWSPDKDLAQCVRSERVLQVDRRSGTLAGEEEIAAKFGVLPESIPDWLALVGDSADGYPGIAGWGKQTASTVLSRYLHIEQIPAVASYWSDEILKKLRSAGKLADRLQAEMASALLFRDLATLRIDRGLFRGVDELEWKGPAANLAEITSYLGSSRLAERALAAASAS